MLKRHALQALGIASALMIGAAGQAVANPILGIELLEDGYSPVQLTSGADPLTLSQSYGTFAVNVVTNFLTANPLSIDLSSVNLSTSTSGTLTLIASATGLTSPLGLSGFVSQFSGTIPFGSNVASASLKTYISNTNTMFGTDTLLDTLSTSGAPFALAGSGATTTVDPFALTLVETVTTTGSALLSLDASAAVAPEIDPRSGLAAIALLLGVLALIGERRRGGPTAAC